MKDSLETLAIRIRRKVEIPAVFNCINTRLIIQYGINLKKITPEQNRSQETIEKVAAALVMMGVKLEDV